MGHRSKIHGFVLIPPSKFFQRKPSPLAPLAGSSDSSLQPNESLRAIQFPDADSLLRWRGLRREIRWNAAGSLRVRLEDCNRDYKISLRAAAFLPTANVAVPDDGVAASAGVKETSGKGGGNENGEYESVPSRCLLLQLVLVWQLP